MNWLAAIPIPSVSTLFEFALTEAAASICTNEVFAWWTRRNQRGDAYQLAMARARDTKRPLIVIGDPDAHVTRGEVGYGDMCVDLTGCPIAPKGIKADITKPGAIPMENDSAVVVIFCVLEYVSDIDAAWAEVLRVAGSNWNVFVVYVDQMTLTAWFYPGVKYVITSAPPTAASLEYKLAQSWTPKPPVVSVFAKAAKPAALPAPAPAPAPPAVTGWRRLVSHQAPAAWRRAA